MRLRPAFMTAALLLAAAPAAALEGDSPTPPPKQDPPAGAPPATAEPAKAEAKKEPVVDPKARAALEKAKGLLQSVRATKASTLSGTVMVRETPIGPLGFDFTWTRGKDGAADSTEVTTDESIDETMRPMIEAQAGPQIRGFVEGLVIGGEPADLLKDCEATFREIDGGGSEVTCTYVGGPREGTKETRRFDATTGLPVEVSTETPQGQTILQERTFSKHGERHRLDSFRHHIPSFAGDPIVITGKLEYMDCGGVPVVWRFVQENPMGNSSTLDLEHITVDGKEYPNPEEKAAAEAKAKKDAETPAPAPAPAPGPGETPPPAPPGGEPR